MTPLNDLYITGGDNCGALMKLGNRVASFVFANVAIKKIYYKISNGKKLSPRLLLCNYVLIYLRKNALIILITRIIIYNK